MSVRNVKMHIESCPGRKHKCEITYMGLNHECDPNRLIGCERCRVQMKISNKKYHKCEEKSIEYKGNKKNIEDYFKV